MRHLAPSLLALFTASAVTAQGAVPAAQSPAPLSPEAAQLLQKACDRMLAAGNGTYASTESQDNAMLRSAHLPMNGKETEVSGGWHGDVSWATAGDNQDQLIRAGNRMLVKDGNDWKLRHSMLPSGSKAPYTVDAALLFAVLRDLPADARKVVTVDTAEIGGKATTVLSLQLRDAAARDFALSGAIPPCGGGPGGMVMMIGGGAPGEPDCEVDLALFVDPQNGDVLRVRARTYESNPDAGNVHIQIQGPGGGDSAEDDDKEDAKAEKKDQKPVFKKGLVDRKPTKTESLMYFKADFKAIGTTKAPELADKQKALLNRR
jgi:nitrogen fixation protein